MRMLITGAAGMLGSEAMEYYGKKYTCIGTDIVKDYYTDSLIDITNYTDVLNLFNEIKPDIVLHCAAMINVDECELNYNKAHNINTLATLNIADICSHINAKLIYISTSMVFDGYSKTPYIETDETAPLNVYSHTKYEGERLIMDRVKNHLIIRTNIFGTKPGSFGMWIYDTLKNGQDIRLYKNIYFNTLYVPDFLKHLEMIIDKTGIYHLSSRDSMTKLEYGQLMKEKTFYNQSKIYSSNYSDMAVKRPRHAVLDCSKFENETGVKLPTIDETMEKFLRDVMIYGN